MHATWSQAAIMSKMYSTANLSDKELKEQGNRLFDLHKYEDAASCYTKAIVSIMIFLMHAQSRRTITWTVTLNCVAQLRAPTRYSCIAAKYFLFWITNHAVLAITSRSYDGAPSAWHSNFEREFGKSEGDLKGT